MPIFGLWRIIVQVHDKVEESKEHPESPVSPARHPVTLGP